MELYKFSTLDEYNEAKATLASEYIAYVVETDQVFFSNDTDVASSMMQNVTWSELKELRDQGKLAKGYPYRITDYVTMVDTIMNTDARSAQHRFDIIVWALDDHTLSEDAKAIQHEGDSYFANSNLAAWEIKYKLDNVYWSLAAGEYCQALETSYSFKKVGTIELDGTNYILWEGNVNYQRDWDTYAVSESDAEGDTLYVYYNDGEFNDETAGTISNLTIVTQSGCGTITYLKDEFNNECPYDFKTIQFKRWNVDDAKQREGIHGNYMGVLNELPVDLSIPDEDDYIWCYTFSSNNEGGEQEDYSLGGHNVYDNVFYGDNNNLNNNVMFGSDCYRNTFSGNCSRNTFGSYCYNNTFSIHCHRNTFGYNCFDNTFENDCYRNTFGNSCYDNTFGNDCYSNTFISGCFFNIFGKNCHYNTFGDHCLYNSFGNDCYYNTFGNACQYNTFGNDCNNNKFGNSSTTKSYYENIIIENGNKYIYLDCSATTSSSTPLRNIKIAQSVNTTYAYKTITHTTVNDTFQTIYRPTGSTEVEV